MQILAFSAKWFKGQHITKGWIDYRSKDDRDITRHLWKLLDEADVIVAHNGNRFDLPTINARFIYHGLTPPSPYRKIDTLLEARKHLRLPSNKLDDLGEYYNLGRKVEHEGFPLWKKCMAGDQKAWKRMLKYNKQDVILLERFYLTLRPWIVHPNIGMWDKGYICGKCGSKRIQLRGFAINQTTKYRRFVCKNCGGWSRSPFNVQENKVLRPL